jgi:glycosyltransferase involved in cell wall biosynthesis
MISIVIISKDEPSLDGTLADVAAQADKLGQADELGEPCEIVVVDASDGRLDDIKKKYENHIRWIQFSRPAGVSVSIPHQRNAGVKAALGDVIVFTDAGCTPGSEWLARLVAPLRDGEYVSAGVARSAVGDAGVYDGWSDRVKASLYLDESGAGNLAFRREAFDAVGGFDERFAYGSDIDFTWRLVDAGYRLRSVPDAIIYHDYGKWRRQLRRSYVYGKARARLYRKHRARLRHVLRKDPMVVVYPAFLLGLPLTLIFPLYPLLLLVPIWRNRSGGPIKITVDHLTFGVGILAELAGR